MWNVTDWQKVVFRDESRFVLRTDDNCVRVWRHTGPFLSGLPGAIFQQDNARPHTSWLFKICGPSASGQLKVTNQLNARPCGGMYCSWRWSNALLKLSSICVVAYPVFV
ncbi:transposable element Tcb2 transposase [Trichonephila clavipes]|nr:transposable element Tcb2 transposase [Trichonephila clavipes]